MKFRRITNEKKPKINDLFPCLSDNIKYTGFDRHYVYHTAWAARVVKKINPEFHIDISSSLYFCSIVSAFIPVKFYDFRPAELSISNLTSDSADLTNLHFENNSIDSISCMHTIEHIGLGRYGDTIDPDGDKKAIAELKRVVKPGGNLIFVSPVGQPIIMFNGQRIYSFEWVINQFDGFELKEFALVPDDKKVGFLTDADPGIVEQQKNGCGCFWFTKK